MDSKKQFLFCVVSVVFVSKCKRKKELLNNSEAIGSIISKHITDVSLCWVNVLFFVKLVSSSKLYFNMNSKGKNGNKTRKILARNRFTFSHHRDQSLIYCICIYRA